MKQGRLSDKEKKFITERHFAGDDLETICNATDRSPETVQSVIDNVNPHSKLPNLFQHKKEATIMTEGASRVSDVLRQRPKEINPDVIHRPIKK